MTKGKAMAADSYLLALKNTVDGVCLPRDERLAECRAGAQEVLRLYAEGETVSPELAAAVITRLLIETTRGA